MSMNVEEAAVFSTKTWQQNVTYPLLIALKVAMIALAVLTAIQVATPNISWVPFVFLCFFAALEGVYSTNWLGTYEQLGTNRAYYRIAELAFIALIVRLFSWVTSGTGWPTFEIFQYYLRAPFSFFGDAYFIISFLLVAFAWQRGVGFSMLFNQLAISKMEEAFFTRRDHQTGDVPVYPQRGALVSSFFRQWTWGGIILLIGVALTTFQLGDVTSRLNLFEVTRQAVRPSLIIGMLIYFLIGFWLLSQARLLALNGRWLIEGIKPSEQIPKRWSNLSLRLLLSFAFIAAFIPIGSTVPAARVLSTLLAGVVYLLNLIFFFFSFLFFGLISLFMPNLDNTGTETQEPPPPPSFEELLPPPEASEPNEMLLIFVTSLIWSLIIVGGVSAVLFIMRDRGKWVNGRFFQKVWLTFKQWLSELWFGVEEQLALVQQALQARRATAETDEEAPPKPPWRFIRLNALSPRDQIRYFYLSTVKRAGQKGVERSESNTPLEYAKQLKTHWPDAENELEDLTNAFLHARYSPRPIEKDDVNPVKRKWQQVKRNLRRRKAKPKPE